MCGTPVLNHPSLNPIILGPEIAPYSAWPAVFGHSIPEKDFNRSGSLVGTARKVDDQSGETINASVDVEAPGPKFLVSIVMP